MVYKPSYFQIYELVPAETFASVPKHILWNLFDNRILITADWLRKRYGKAIANTWYWKGEHQYRGWRPGNCKIGAEYSQHKFGRALDLVFTEISAYDIRQNIFADPFHPDFEFITCLETNIDWLHFDCRNWNKQKHGILTVKP